MNLSPGARKYFGNTSWLIAERVLRLLVTLLVVALLARYLGPNQFGLLSYATAVFSIFAVAGTLGLNRILVRESVSRPQMQSTILGTAVVLRLITGGVLVIIIYFVADIFDAGDPVTPILAVIIGTSLLFQSLYCIELWFQAEVKAKQAVTAKSIAFIIMAAMKIFLIFIGAPLIAFAFTITGEFALGALMLIIVYRSLGNRLKDWKFDKPLAKDFLSEGWPEILAGLGTLVCMRMDQIMIGQMIDADGVGIYTAASQLSEALYFIPVAVVSSTFPAILAAKKRDENTYYLRLQQLLSGLTIYSYIVAIAVTLMSSWIISLLYGEKFSGAADVLVIHVWTGVAVGLGIASGSWIMAEKKVKLNLYRTVFGALLNIILNYFLIQSMGITGAAIATLVSLVSAFYLFDLVYSQTRNMFLMKTRALFCNGLAAK
jgi:PST family polysaccharide transporter